jgi:hypothetical protein
MKDKQKVSRGAESTIREENRFRGFDYDIDIPVMRVVTAVISEVALSETQISLCH